MPDQPSLGLTPLSRVRLDELLAELLDRVGDVVDSRERLRALLDAVVGIGSDLDLRSTLERIIEAACQLAGARYGALGVIGSDRRLVEFITHGVTAQQRAAIGDPPSGHGVLGLLIEQPHALRMPDITRHPRSYGFPPHHPPMHSFLGVPIHIRDRVFGNLYLAEKQGASEFSEDDEAIVVALAAAAGVAIENARLYAEAGRRERWLAATAEITNLLLGEVQRTDALQRVARWARQVADGELAMVLLLDEDTDTLRVEVADAADPGDGLGPADVEALIGAAVPAADTFAPVVAERRPMTMDSLAKSATWPVPVPGGPAVVAPLAAGETLHGVLVVAHPAHPDHRLEDDRAMLETFAGQAALALERARAQDEREMIVVLEDRERIARDLHDVVIQRLFATGLQLQTAARLASRPDVSERVGAAVESLDTTIHDIRTAIFELRSPTGAQLRADIRRVVDEAVEALGFRPRLRLDGPVDSAVPEELRPDLLAVLQESLSNVVKHARASVVEVDITVADRQLSVRVADDGVGPDGVQERGGLRNLRGRADDHDGTFTVDRSGSGGTALVWTVPV